MVYITKAAETEDRPYGKKKKFAINNIRTYSFV